VSFALKTKITPFPKIILVRILLLKLTQSNPNQNRQGSHTLFQVILISLKIGTWNKILQVIV
jgi:hypothetical protein